MTKESFVPATSTVLKNTSTRLLYRAFVMVFTLGMLHTLSPQVHAHHGRDFILLQDSAIPAQFSGVFTTGYQWTRDGSNDSFSTEPSFYLGLTSSLAFGLSAGFSDDGDGWNYTGVTPQIVWSILGPTGPRNVRIGLWAGYEFAESTDSTTGIQTTAQNGGTPGSGPDARSFSTLTDPGKSPFHSGHTAVSGNQDDRGPRGIHRHGESGLYTRIIVEADITEKTRAIANLISFVPVEGGQVGFGYAAGMRHEVNHDLSFGIEALGEFLSYGSSHEVMLTTMIGLPRHLAFRLGVGGGLTRSSPDFTLSTSILWRF